MATWKQFTQKMLIEAACSKNRNEVDQGNPNVGDNEGEDDPVIDTQGMVVIC